MNLILIFVVDILSRDLRVQPLEDKKFKSNITAFASSLPNLDNTKPFRSREEASSAVDTPKGVEIYYVSNWTKAYYTERTFLTQRSESMYGYFMHVQKYKYVGILQDVAKCINKTPNLFLL